MKKQLIRQLFLLLLPILAFGQGPDLINTVADTASLSTIRGGDGQVMYLRQYSSTDTSGGGWFIVRTSSESTGTNYFSHPDPAKQWVRRDTDALEQGFVADTTALKLLFLGEGKTAYLKQLSSTNTNGGGWWVVLDSTYEEGIIQYNHLTSGLGWINQDVLISGEINVDLAGAVGDGATNDSAAIYNTIKLSSSVGMKTVFSGKTYFTAGAIDIDATNNIIIKGVANHTRITNDDAGNFYIFRFDTCNNVTLEDMIIQSTRTAGAAFTVSSGIQFFECDSFSAANLRFIDCSFGLYKSKYGNIDNMFFVKESAGLSQAFNANTIENTNITNVTFGSLIVIFETVKSTMPESSP